MKKVRDEFCLQFLEEGKANLILRDENIYTSHCSLNTYYAYTCYFSKASQHFYCVITPMLQMKKQKLTKAVYVILPKPQSQYTELTTYLEACVFYNTHYPALGPDTQGIKRQVRKPVSVRMIMIFGGQCRAAWPESPQRGIERAELRSVIIRTCISSVLRRVRQRPPGEWPLESLLTMYTGVRQVALAQN